MFPQCGNRTAAPTVDYLVRAATALEPLGQRWPDKVVLSVGSEVSRFSRGILPGRSFAARMNHPNVVALVKSGEHRAPLHAFVSKTVAAVRRVYRGKISYDSLIWEEVDWTPFDYVGVDHYRAKGIEKRYVEMMCPAFESGKPVVVTEFGHEAMRDAPMSGDFLSSAGLEPSVINVRSQFHHPLPLIGRIVRPRLVRAHVWDENYQAGKLTEQLEILENAGVDGAFVS